MYSVLGNHKTMTHRYTVNVIHVYRGNIVFTQQVLNLYLKRPPCYALNFYLQWPPMLCVKLLSKKAPYAKHQITTEKGPHVMR